MLIEEENSLIIISQVKLLISQVKSEYHSFTKQKQWQNFIL